MKIRWTGSSVRFRISPRELDALGRGEAVEETLRVGAAGAWRASLERGPATQLTMEGEALTIALSAADYGRLADLGTEGVYLTAGEFRYLVEKDFPCVHPRAAEALEPPGETFPPPAGFNERKS